MKQKGKQWTEKENYKPKMKTMNQKGKQCTNKKKKWT